MIRIYVEQLGRDARRVVEVHGAFWDVNQTPLTSEEIAVGLTGKISEDTTRKLVAFRKECCDSPLQGIGEE
jgi:hypothetical protein